MKSVTHRPVLVGYSERIMGRTPSSSMLLVLLWKSSKIEEDRMRNNIGAALENLKYSSLAFSS